MHKKLKIFSTAIMLIIPSAMLMSFSPFSGDYKWSDPVSITNLNTEEDDFAPSWNPFDKVLYFNSISSGYSKFFYTTKLDSLRFDAPKPIKGALSKKKGNLSYITFPAQDLAYFCAYRQGDSRAWLNIYASVKKKMAWTDEYILDSLSVDAFCAHPAVSPDGSSMIFSSNRNSDTKDSDLWMAYKQSNGSWGSLVRLDELNSSGNDITPFLASADSLYFASDGHEGPGGYDIFLSVRDRGHWGRPRPLENINTQSDESDFIILPDGTAIFASNRPGGKGKLDLYASIPVKEKVAPKPESIDIYLETLASNINIKKKYSYRSFQLLPYYIKANIPQSGKILDSLLNASMGILQDRFKNSNAVIFIKSSTSADADALSNLFKFPVQRVFFKEDPSAQTAFAYDDDKGLMKPVQIGQSLTETDPPQLDIFVDSRPREAVTKWDCSVYFDETRADTIFKGNTVPMSFSLDLKKYHNLIFKSDSIVVRLNYTTSDGKKLSRDTSLIISRREINERELVEIGGKPAEEFYVVIPGESINTDDASIREYAQLISESAEFSNKTSITYFSPQSKRKSIELKDMLLSKIKRKGVTISVEYENFKENKFFSKELSPLIIKVSVEKAKYND